MSKKRFSCIILSAGFSSRMGDFKPLLRIGPVTVIEHAVQVFLDAGIEDISVVTGYRSNELTDILNKLKVSGIYNPLYEQGMFSSVKAGVNSISVCNAFFILPVDIPLIRQHTIRSLIKIYSNSNPDVVYPVFQEKRGHPPLISYRIADDILQYNGKGGLNELLLKYADIIDHQVPDNGILLDCDTAEDYEYLLKRFQKFDIPSVDECREIIKIYKVDRHIIKHCEFVAALAVFLGKIINLSQEELDLITAAGLLHDLVRKEPNHDIAGAAIIDELGFPEVANIVKTHMNIHIDDNESQVNASQIVYIADKLIDGTEIINLEDRFSEKIRNAENIEIKTAVQTRLNNAMIIKERIENICIKKLEILLSEFKQQNKNDLFTETR